MLSAASQKSSPFCVDFSPDNMKIRRSRKGIFQFCHIILCQEVLDQNQPVCFRIFVKEKLNITSKFFGCFLLTEFLRRRMMSMYISLLTVVIPLNCTSELLYSIPVNSCKCLKGLRKTVFLVDKYVTRRELGCLVPYENVTEAQENSHLVL